MSLPSREDARNRLRPFGLVFEKSLHDLIRGIRAAKDVSAREKFLNNAISECRVEASSPDMEVKTQAILKLSYLEMYGYDMSWASFHVLEVMSSPKFQQKRVGYLAAIQSFRTDTDILMLTTNLLKKDINSAHHLEISVALSGIASIVTPSLAQDLSDDILKMLKHSKPYIRKKAILAMYKVFLQFPEALKTSYLRLKDKLSDPDPSVVSATVNVICELSKTNSKNYIFLAPPLYELLTTSSNNWMLIKILKLFSSLVPQEPRLKAKLLPPILELIQNTSAKSLLYECINCIVSSGMLDADDYEIASICVEKLRTFLETSDQNLKFVGLLALSKIIKIHPQFVFSNEDIILRCVDDPDITIRQRALDMVSGVVNDDNITDIITQLKSQLTPDIQNVTIGDSGGEFSDLGIPKSYRISVIRKIIEICSKDMYSLVPDFEWYVSILVELLQLADGADEVAEEIGNQLRDIAVRVVEVRDTVVVASVSVASRQYTYSKMPSVLPIVLWVIGEYARYIPSSIETIYLIIQFLQSLSPENTGIADASSSLLPSIVFVGIEALVKIFSQYGSMPVGWTPNRAAVIEAATEKLVKFFEFYSTSLNFEIQERATEFLELFKLVQQALEEHPDDSIEAPGLLTIALPSLFSLYEINPVAPGSQLHIPVPAGLDLDAEIYPSYPLSDEEFLDNEDDWDVIGGGGIQALPVGIESSEHEWKSSVAKIIMTHENENAEEALRRKLERLERQKDDPFYISVPSTSGTPLESQPITPEYFSGKSVSVGPTTLGGSVVDTDTGILDINSIPISKLDITGGNFNIKKKPRTKVSIIRDEVIGSSNGSSDAESLSLPGDKPGGSSRKVSFSSTAAVKNKSVQKFQSAFRVNSSGLESFDLSAPDPVDTNIEQEVQKLRETIATPKASLRKSKSTKSSSDPSKPRSHKKKSSTKSSKEEQQKATLKDSVTYEDTLPSLVSSVTSPANPVSAELLGDAPVKVPKKKKKTKVRKATIE